MFSLSRYAPESPPLFSPCRFRSSDPPLSPDPHLQPQEYLDPPVFAGLVLQFVYPYPLSRVRSSAPYLDPPISPDPPLFPDPLIQSQDYLHPSLSAGLDIPATVSIHISIYRDCSKFTQYVLFSNLNA